MKVHHITNSLASEKIKATIEQEMEYTPEKNVNYKVILVPDMESYNFAQGELLLKGLQAEVVCICPPSTYLYTNDMGYPPLALVNDKYNVYYDLSVEEDSQDSAGYQYTYAFERKTS